MPLPPELVQWRKNQRSVLLAQRMAIGKALRSTWNDRITELLVASFPLTPAVVVAGYWPFKGEFDPRFAMHAW